MAWGRFKSPSASAFSRLDYQTRVTNYTITATTVGAAAELFTDASWTADGVSTYTVEVFAGVSWYQATANYNIYLSLCKGDGTELASLAQLSSSSSSGRAPIGIQKYFYTPAAGTQTVNVRAYKESGSGDGTIEVAAGSGRVVAGVAYIAVYRGGV